MAYSEGLASRTRAVLKRGRGMGERRMFGGVCFTMNGHMVCGVVKNDLMVRVGPDAYRKSLRRPHARPMDFTGRPMIGFVYVAAAGLKSDASLKSWIGAGLAHARTLPPKSAKTKRPKRKLVTKSSRQPRAA
jgi:TfoX/Sxy family transcriptional regulator of competence genes